MNAPMRPAAWACARLAVAAVLALPAVRADADEGDAAAPRFPRFTDITEKSGLSAFRHDCGDGDMDNIVEAVGAGPCLFDFDGDGDLDVFFANGKWTKGVSDNRGRDRIGKLRNALFRNDAGVFTDVTETAGVAGRSMAFSASSADYDGDGDLDLYVCCNGPNELYRNDGRGRFTEVAAEAGVADPRLGLSAVWLDPDVDGDLDLYVCNYLEYDAGRFRSYYAATGFPGPLSYIGQADAYFRNDGKGKFADATQEAGLTSPAGRGMGVVAADLDGDGRTDVYVSNDAMENEWFRGTGGGKFEERAAASGLAFGQNGQGVSSMGPVIGDVNRDGHLDLLIPDMDYMSLLVRRESVWVDQVTRSNIARLCGQYTGWGGVLADFDCDGHLDVFIANGHPHHEYPENAVLLRNDGRGVFTDVAPGAGDHFGTTKWYSRGAAAADLDDDGDPDLLVCGLNRPPQLLRNDGGNRNRWLVLDVRTDGGKVPALGARVTVTAEGRTMVDEVSPVRGYLSQGDARLHFGLGRAERVDRIEVRFPGGRTVVREGEKADRIVQIVPEKK